MKGNTVASSTKDPIVWIDCEMTGLSLDSDALIEVAVIVTSPLTTNETWTAFGQGELLVFAQGRRVVI